MAGILSVYHVAKLGYQVIREFDDRVELPQLEQGLILVDADLQNWES